MLLSSCFIEVNILPPHRFVARLLRYPISGPYCAFKLSSQRQLLCPNQPVTYSPNLSIVKVLQKFRFISSFIAFLPQGSYSVDLHEDQQQVRLKLQPFLIADLLKLTTVLNFMIQLRIPRCRLKDFSLKRNK